MDLKRRRSRSILSFRSSEELEQFIRGCGWTPYFVEGDDPDSMHELMAATMATVVEEIRRIQHNARTNGDTTRPRWPMIVLKSPKGWIRHATPKTPEPPKAA